MALVSEIVEFIRKAPKDDFWGSVEVALDNWGEAIRHPSVSLAEERLEFTPGSFDATVARIALTVKGCTFVRRRDDPMWQPKGEDDLIGVRAFVNSICFAVFGHPIEDSGDVQQCREETMRIVSELLNVRVNVEAYFSRPYSDWVNGWYDFDVLQKRIFGFPCRGYAYENGKWVAKMDGENLIGSRACALALLESLDEDGTRSHFYANFPTEIYESVKKIAKDDGNGEMMRLVSSLYRGQVFRDSNYMDRRYVFLLLSNDTFATLHRHLSASRHELASHCSWKFVDAYRRAERRWERDVAGDLAHQLALRARHA